MTDEDNILLINNNLPIVRLDLYHNPSADLCLEALGISLEQIERFRGCGVQDGQIVIHCRTGGGNREGYPNEKLTSNPHYIRDEDDDFDSTYADYYFRIPEDRESIKNTEDKEARAVFGDVPTAIGILFGDEKAQNKALERLNALE